MMSLTLYPCASSDAASASEWLTASLDTQGYSVNDIIHILMAEGGQV